MRGVLTIVGATATGKSSLALAVAERTGAEIVNADALQVYRGFDLGTAKPSAEERARVPHHLLDVAAPEERFSAGRFAALAQAALADIRARGRPAIVVGGSGLYVRALCAGLAPIPPVARELRAELESRLAREGLAPLRAELEAVDPASAARLAPRDAQRTLRALEVAHGTGRPLSRWLAESASARREWSGPRVGLTLPRAALYDRIGARVDRMIARGWLDEVRGLLASGVRAEAPAFQAIGYAQWVRHLAGEFDLEEATRQIVVATRRYAKRQQTWFRREPGIDWHAPEPADALADRLARACAG